MRIRTPFAAAFGVIAIGSAYLGLGPSANPTPVNDKALHAIAFFGLTLTGYWIVETSRRVLMKIVPMSALVAGVASEFVQVILNPNREFDAIDIAFNLVGSFVAMALCSWYHERMLDRKRKRRMQGYGVVTTDDVADIELGEGPGLSEDGQLMDPPASDEEDDDDGAAWDNMDDDVGETLKDHEQGENGKKSAE